MSNNLDTLRKIAEAATPGPWEWEEPSKNDWPTGDESLVQSDGNEVILMGWGYDASGIEAEQVDRNHVATFDPPTVLALLSRLEQAEQAVQRVRELAGRWIGRVQGPDHWVQLLDMRDELLRTLDGDQA